MNHYDKKVIDHVDLLFEQEHTKNDKSFSNKYENVPGRIRSLKRIHSRLLGQLGKVAKRGDRATKGSHAEFIMNALSYTEDLEKHLENTWGYPGCLSDRYYESKCLEELEYDKSKLPQVDRQVVDWFDKIVKEDYNNNLFDKKHVGKGLLSSIKRIDNRLQKSVDKMPKDFNDVKKNPKMMFVLNAKVYATHLIDSLQKEFYGVDIVQNKSNQYFNIVDDK